MNILQIQVYFKVGKPASLPYISTSPSLESICMKRPRHLLEHSIRNLNSWPTVPLGWLHSYQEMLHNSNFNSKIWMYVIIKGWNLIKVTVKSNATAGVAIFPFWSLRPWRTLSPVLPRWSLRSLGTLWADSGFHVLQRLVHLQKGGGKVLVPPPCLQCVDLVESGGEHGEGDHHGDGEEAHDEGHRLLPTIDATTSCLVVHLNIIQRRHFYNL